MPGVDPPSVATNYCENCERNGQLLKLAEAAVEELRERMPMSTNESYDDWPALLAYDTYDAARKEGK